MTPAELAERIAAVAAVVAAERAAQGLPPTITDPATLERAADLLVPPEGAAAERPSEPTAR
jgi:hypothetical protein